MPQESTSTTIKTDETSKQPTTSTSRSLSRTVTSQAAAAMSSAAVTSEFYDVDGEILYASTAVEESHGSLQEFVNFVDGIENKQYSFSTFDDNRFLELLTQFEQAGHKFDTLGLHTILLIALSNETKVKVKVALWVISHAENEADIKMLLGDLKPTKLLKKLLISFSCNQGNEVVRKDHLELIECIISRNIINPFVALCSFAERDDPYRNHETYFQHVVRENVFDVVNVFLQFSDKFGVEAINKPNSKGETPLFLLLKNGSWGQAQLLINQYKASFTTEEANSYLKTILADSYTRGHYHEVIEFLLKQGAIIPDDALLSAAKQGANYVDVLLSHRTFDLDKRDNQGNTALHIACATRNIDMARSLLRAGANLNLQHFADSIALYTAVRAAKNKDVLDLLLPLKDQLDTLCFDRSLLMEASAAGDIGVVQALLKAGANPNLPQASGETALSFAKNAKVVSLLLSSGAKIDKNNHANFTMILSAYSGNKDVFVELCKHVDLSQEFAKCSPNQMCLLNNLINFGVLESAEPKILCDILTSALKSVATEDQTKMVGWLISSGVMQKCLQCLNSSTDLKNFYENLHADQDQQEVMTLWREIVGARDCMKVNDDSMLEYVKKTLHDDSSRESILRNNFFLFQPKPNDSERTVRKRAADAGVIGEKVSASKAKEFEAVDSSLFPL